MLTVKLRFLLLTVLLSLAACQLTNADDGDGDPPVPPPTVALTDFSHDLAVGICTRAFACCDGAGLAALFPDGDAPVTVAACVPRAEALFAFTDEKAGVAIGAIVYDGEAAARTLSDLATQACSALRSPLDGGQFAAIAGTFMASVFHGQIAPGGACDTVFACAIAPALATCAAGRCVAYAEPGAACTDAPCLPLDFCNADSVCEGARLTGGVCTTDDECGVLAHCNAASVCEVDPALCSAAP